jgi:hypothetical protein
MGRTAVIGPPQALGVVQKEKNTAEPILEISPRVRARRQHDDEG